MENNDISRRKFLTTVLGIPVAGATLPPVLAVASYVYPPASKTKPPQPYAVPGALEMQVGGTLDFEYDGVGSTLIRKSETEYLALSRKCTHLGCTAKWTPSTNKFVCPCHGGEYDAEGKNVAGPPPLPLPRWKVDIVGDKVMVSPGIA